MLAEDTGAGRGVTPVPAADGRRARRWVTMALVVLSSVGVLASSLAVWSKRTVLDTDVFVRRATAVTSDPAVTAALSSYLTEQVLAAMDPHAEATQALPDRAQRLVGPLVAAIGSYVEREVDQVLQSDAFQDTLATLLRLAHAGALDLLEGETLVGSQLQGDEVVLNTIPIIADVLRRLGADGVVDRLTDLPAFGGDQPPSEQVQRLAAATGVSLPPDFGQITVLTSSSLSAAQGALQLFRRLVVLIVAVTIGLIIVTLLLSPRRRRTLAQLGVGVALAMAAGTTVIRWAQDQVVDDVARRAGNPEAPGVGAAEAVVDQLLVGLRGLSWLLVALGLLVALIGFFSGDGGTARRARRSFGGSRAGDDTGVLDVVAAHPDAVRLLSAALGLALLLWLGLTVASLLGALVLVALGLFVTSILTSARAPIAAADGGPAPGG